MRAGCWLERQTIGFNCFLESWNQGSVPYQSWRLHCWFGWPTSKQHPLWWAEPWRQKYSTYEIHLTIGSSLPQPLFFYDHTAHDPLPSTSFIIIHHSTFLHPQIRTGELINIDFGIAFERGKNLQMPEMVPFRLTRDIVAGLGCLGTCGLFRRCAEAAMALLRQNGSLVMAAGAPGDGEPVAMPLGRNGRLWPWLEVTGISIWLFNIAMDNGPFIDGLPIKNGDFPWLC